MGRTDGSKSLIWTFVRSETQTKGFELESTIIRYAKRAAKSQVSFYGQIYRKKT